jgi:hypothetical protein
MGVSLVKKNRAAALGGELQLRDERPLLQISRREIAAVVETALTDGDDLGVVKKRPQGRQAVDVETACVMGVNAGRREQGPRACLGKLERPHTARHRCSADDEASHTRARRAFQHGVTICVETVVPEIEADIDQAFHWRGL